MKKISVRLNDIEIRIINNFIREYEEFLHKKCTVTDVIRLSVGILGLLDSPNITIEDVIRDEYKKYFPNYLLKQPIIDIFKNIPTLIEENVVRSDEKS